MQRRIDRSRTDSHDPCIRTRAPAASHADTLRRLVDSRGA
jgi:hypothetical protein